jgi:hypothetical protein
MLELQDVVAVVAWFVSQLVITMELLVIPEISQK